MKLYVPQGKRLPLNIVVGASSLITLFFSPSFNDPFNAPKSWILSVAGFWLLGWCIFHAKTYWSQKPLKWVTIISGAYLFTMSASLLASNNKFISFFGEYQRRTGYLSYLCLIVFLLASSYLLRLNNISKLVKAMVIVGFFVAVYGFFQHYKHDFVKWNNSYNPVISTLGNPDFAGALMAIFLIASFGVVIQQKFSILFRIFAGLNTVLLLTVIYFSQVRQGLLAAAIGVFFILLVRLHQSKKTAAYSLSAIGLIASAVATAGMLDHGPFARYFYKLSVTYRGDYWRAGWRMFINHPIFGVGLDRYGAYFRQYRDATQSLRRGPEFVSNAAHNIPIQTAATAGIFVLTALLTLIFFIFCRGVVALKNTEGSDQILVAVIFAMWLAYQAQSLISIDNLAVAIWGYILGGAVVGISLRTQNILVLKKNASVIQPFISGLLAMFAFIVSILFLGAESSMHELSAQPNPKTQADVASYEQMAKKPLGFIFQEPSFKRIIANDFAYVSNFPAAIIQLKEIIANDPLNSDAQNLLARIYEYQRNWSDASLIRKTISYFDPYNQVNLLQLGIDYKNQGDIVSARAVIPLINSFAPHSVEAKQAIIDFGK